MTHAVPPTDGAPSRQGKNGKPVQRPVDPTKFIPPESVLDPAYDDMMNHVVPGGDSWIADLAGGKPYGRRTPHYLDPDGGWNGPEVDLTPYTCPEIRSAG